MSEVEFAVTRKAHRLKGRPEELGMSDAEATYLEKLYNKDDIVFEWGSGWSTVYFKDLVKSYYSAEHDNKWCNLVFSELMGATKQNVEMFFKPPHDIKFDKQFDDVAHILLKEWSTESVSRPPPEFEVESYEEDGIWYYKGRSGLDWHCFIDYLNTIEEANEERFDKVVVDGRVRPFCAFKAIEYMDENSTLIVHDFTTRPWNHSILEWFDLTDTAGTFGVFKKK